MVVRLDESRTSAGPQTPGIERRELLQHGDRWVGWARTEPGIASGWHHHADWDTYIFPTHGSITFEYGPGGREQMTVRAGEFAFMPARTVHRETTGASQAGGVFLLRVGSGPQAVNVDGPDPVTA
jgi:uncharacterized RmlC-like cupin family protein